MAVLCAHNVRNLISFELRRAFQEYKDELLAPNGWPRVITLETITISTQGNEENQLILQIQNGTEITSRVNISFSCFNHLINQMSFIVSNSRVMLSLRNIKNFTQKVECALMQAAVNRGNSNFRKVITTK